MFQSNFNGLPTSSNCIIGLFNNSEFFKNCLYFSSPIFLAISKVPIFDDLINISSTDKLLGNFFMSEISYFEHLIDFVILFTIVFGLTRLLSKASATVKVLKIEPSS